MEAVADVKSVLRRAGLFQQAPLPSCSCSVQSNLGGKRVCCETLAAVGVCVCTVNEGGKVLPTRTISESTAVNCWQTQLGTSVGGAKDAHLRAEPTESTALNILIRLLQHPR